MFSFTSRILFGAMVSTIVASALFGGGRMDNVGSWLATAANQVPGNELVTGPIGLLHDLSMRSELEWARHFGTFVVTALLLLAAAYALIRLYPPKLAWGATRRQTVSRWPIVLADLVVGVLPLLLVWVWLLRVALGYGDRYAPVAAVISAGGLLIVLVVAVLVLFNLQDDKDPRITSFKLSAKI